MASSGFDCTDSRNRSRPSTAQMQSVRATTVSMRGRRERHEVKPKMSPGPRVVRNLFSSGNSELDLSLFDDEDVPALFGLEVDARALLVTLLRRFAHGGGLLLFAQPVLSVLFAARFRIFSLHVLFQLTFAMRAVLLGSVSSHSIPPAACSRNS